MQSTVALHLLLPIYRAAEDLLDVVTDVVTNMQRNFKRSIGEKIKGVSERLSRCTVWLISANAFELVS